MTRRRPGRPRTAVVVGAGLAGLSAALHLAGAGVEVTVVEQAVAVGGRAAGAVRSGTSGRYRLDTGPTVLTETAVLDRCFRAVGEHVTDRLQLHTLDPAYRVCFADGSQLDLTTDPARMHDRIRALAGQDDADGYLRLREHVERLYAVLMPHFIDHNIDGPASVLRPALATVVALGGFRRLAPLVASFVDDQRLQRALSFQALYAGVSPARALGLFSVISAMDLVHGVSYPDGGMAGVPRAMADAARAHGVVIRTGERVERIDARRAGRPAVHTDAGTIGTDAVVVTAEPERARALLGLSARRRAVRSPSCVLLAAGLRAPLHGTAHHTVHFGRAWHEVFEDLRCGRLMRDPSFLVSVPTRTDPGLSPPGGAVLYALFPAPCLGPPGPTATDWAPLRTVYREQVLRHLAAAGYGLLDIDVEEFITPADWAAAGLPGGTPFSDAHTFWQTGPLRTSNVLAPGIVLAGSGTTPGVGVPMVLISGRLAAERLIGVPGRRS